MTNERMKASKVARMLLRSCIAEYLGAHGTPMSEVEHGRLHAHIAREMADLFMSIHILVAAETWPFRRRVTPVTWLRTHFHLPLPFNVVLMASDLVAEYAGQRIAETNIGANAGWILLSEITGGDP